MCFFRAKDEECGEIPVAFVVKKPGSALTQKDVVDYVAQQVSHIFRINLPMHFLNIKNV